MKLAILAACATFALAGCATSGGTDGPKSVYALEGSLTAAMQVATVYAELPTCGHGVAVCSDPATVTRIQTAAGVAVPLVQQAQTVVTSPTASAAQISAALSAATLAVTDLQTLTASVKVK